VWKARTIGAKRSAQRRMAFDGGGAAGMADMIGVVGAQASTSLDAL
jgi:hypothetical protein